MPWRFHELYLAGCGCRSGRHRQTSHSHCGRGWQYLRRLQCYYLLPRRIFGYKYGSWHVRYLRYLHRFQSNNWLRYRCRSLFQQGRYRLSDRKASNCQSRKQRFGISFVARHGCELGLSCERHQLPDRGQRALRRRSLGAVHRRQLLPHPFHRQYL